MIRYLTIFLILILNFNVFSQKDLVIDSLKTLLQNEHEDTLKVELLNSIAKSYYRNLPDTAIRYAEIALKLSLSSDYTAGKARANRILGLSYAGRAEYNKALSYLFLSLKESRKDKDYSYYAATLTSIGIVYRKQSEYDKALEYYLNSLKIIKIEGDSSKISSALNNVGII